MLTQPSNRPFTFAPKAKTPIGRHLFPALAPAVEKLFQLDALNTLYQRCTGAGDVQTFLDRVLDDLGIRYCLGHDDLARIPKTGPVLVVANHPFGALDGVIMAAMLRRVRPDVKVMANYLLGRIPELRELFLLVDPFGGEKSKRDNLRPLRESIRWVQDGGLLAIFPSGEVASMDIRTRQVVEAPWSTTVARIARKAGAPVVPVYFNGRNSALFQLMGLVHPKLRTAMLPAELFKKRGGQIDVRVGSAVPHRKVAAMESDEQISDFLRQRAMILQYRDVSDREQMHAPNVIKSQAQIIPAVPPDDVAREIANLPRKQLLADGGDMAVYEARASQAPLMLRELGRLREITYRATGEGTGKALDVDRFDQWYRHLFVWNKNTREIVGAYRVGYTEEIVAARGEAGLYTSTLWDYRPGLLDRLGPAIEMGRSFIRKEYQRTYAPLLLLWKGIGAIVSNNPKYCTLFGPVSISNDYRTVSKQLMVQFLDETHGASEFAGLARPRHPFATAGNGGLRSHNRVSHLLSDGDTIDDVVADLEPDKKGMPVLLRQYIKLGARFFAYNVDPDFANALDALMYVDLRATDRKLLTRYMGPEGLARFLKHHNLHQ